MPRRAWIVFLSVWPGLAQVWSGQEVLGLLLAALFAATLNLAVVAQFVWVDFFSAGWPAFFAAVAATTWLATMGYTLWWIWRCHPERHKDEIDRLFRSGLEHYLNGRWNDARKLYEQVLALDETDADALMQLGSIFLRTDQPALARRSFRQCLELEAGAKWRWEIDDAIKRLKPE